MQSQGLQEDANQNLHNHQPLAEYMVTLSSGEGIYILAADPMDAAYSALDTYLVNVELMNKQPYYPNNWDLYKDADESMFEPHMFYEVMDWKVAGWELPSSIDCIIRTTHLKTKKVKEYVYKRRHNAEKKIVKLLNSRTHEFCVTTHESQHYIGPNPESDDPGNDELSC